MNKLSRLAQRLLIKHSDLDANTILPEIKTALQTNIANASTRPSTGLLPFMRMLKEDNASLSLNITRNGADISVSDPTVNPGSAAPRYAALPKQIENYLSANLELFPTMRNNEPVSYHNLTITLDFSPSQLAA